MSRVIPSIISSSHTLVLSECILCDDTAPLSIFIPTTSGTYEPIIFEFIYGDTDIPEYYVEDGRIKVKLGNLTGAFLSTQHRVAANVAGKPYFYFFCLTRILGKTLRVEFSLYEQKGLLK